MIWNLEQEKWFLKKAEPASMFICTTCATLASFWVSFQSYCIYASIIFGSISLLSKYRLDKINDKDKTDADNNLAIERQNHREQLERAKLDLDRTNQSLNDTQITLQETQETLTKSVVLVILQQLFDLYFDHSQAEESYKHRVTLFKCEADATSPTNKVLQVYARIGVHQSSSRQWTVDDNDPELCRGIAGKIWFHGVCKTVNVPPLPVKPDSIDMRQYASSLDMTVDEADSLNVKSVSITGVPILAAGYKWGVLILDSAKPDGITGNKTKAQRLDHTSQLISNIITRMAK